MPRLYIEDAITAVYDYFVANLPTMLQTIRTERSDTAPVDYIVLSKRASHKRAFPKITIHKDVTEDDYSTDFETEGQPLLNPWMFHTIAISIEHLSGDKDELDKTLMRYVEAIRRIRAADDTFNNQFIWVQIERVDWTAVFEDQTNKKALQTVIITMQCRTI